MKNKLFCFALIGAGLVNAQTPDLSGVWKANAEKSKGLPPQATYLAIIEQKDGRLTQTTAVTTTQRGEQRSMYRWDLSGKEARGTLGGLPLKSTAKWDGSTLAVAATQPNNRAMTAKYSLSADGNTLTLDTAITGGPREQLQTIVLEKQPDSAGEALRKPEPTASTMDRYKNLKLLGGAPASSIGDTMNGWAFALGKDCQFCHVQGNFASDDKPEKATARKMVAMVMDVNKNHFGGGQAVRCFTCHQGSNHPPAAKF